MFGLAPRARTTPRQSKIQAPVAGKDGDSLVVGRRVRTHPKGLMGVIRWVGPTHFSAGVWIGVELDTHDGRNDGEVQGSRYFNCASGHGVFVRPDHCEVLKAAVPANSSVPSSSTPSKERRPRGSFGTERTPTLSRKGSQSSLISENVNLGASGIPSNAWGTSSEAGGGRKDAARRVDGGIADKRSGGITSASDDQLIGRLLASEAFSRVVSAAVADRVRTEMASRDTQAKHDEKNAMERMCQLEQMVDDAGGAMDDIAAMVQTISESVSDMTAPPDARDAAAGVGGGGSGGGGGAAASGGSGGGGGSGDAGGGGRDDARVAELTKLLCTVHDMSSQAADLLRTERKENHARVQYLTGRVRELEQRTHHHSGMSIGSEPSEG